MKVRPHVEWLCGWCMRVMHPGVVDISGRATDIITCINRDCKHFGKPHLPPAFDSAPAPVSYTVAP